MASLIRAVVRCGPRMVRYARMPPLSVTNRTTIQPTCSLFTSKKNKDSASIAVSDKHHEPSKTAEDLEEKEENWISYGYSLVDRDEDEWAHHMILFTSITLALVCGTFFMAYYPDFGNHAWAQREAYLELERREREGLPLIDINVVDPAKIQLPSEEELGDFDIIV